MLQHQLPQLPPFQAFWDELPRSSNGSRMRSALLGRRRFRWRRATLSCRPTMGVRGSRPRLGSVGDHSLRRRQSHVRGPGLRRRDAPHRTAHCGAPRTTTSSCMPSRCRPANRAAIAWTACRGACHVAGFVPNYAVELTPSGPMFIPDTARTATTVSGSGGRTRHPSARPGPTYVCQCTLCGKKFRRKTRESGLREHKTPDGWACRGRRALYLTTEY